MTEERSGGIASFGVSFGGTGRAGDGDGSPRPFHITVIAELSAGPDWSTGRQVPLDPIPIDTESFDRVMGAVGPALAIDVDDPFGRGEPALRIDLVLRDRKSLRPNEIAAQVPALRALAAARRVVQDVAARRIDVDAARAQLTRILPRPSWADALVSEVRPARASSPAAESAPEPSPAKASPAAGGLDALLDMVDVPASRGPAAAPPPPVEAPPRTALGDLVASVARSARPAKHQPALVGTALQRLDGAFARLLDAIVSHPEMRRLEGTWRGLRLLVESCDTRRGVEVDVICAGREDVTGALDRLADPGPVTRTAPDLLVIDQRVTADARSLASLEEWASRAEALLAPLVLAGAPALLGADTVEQVAWSTRALSSSEEAGAVATRAVAARDAARWVCIVLNDPLVRAPYTAESSRQAEPPFQQDPDPAEAHVFASGAYVVAALCARTHARIGWPAAIGGARDGALGNLPVRTVRHKGHEVAIPLEASTADDAVKEAGRAGLTLLACGANTDAAVLSRAPMLHRPTAGGGAADSTLSDALFVGRLGRALQQLAAAIPGDTEPRRAEEVVRAVLGEAFESAPPTSTPEIAARVDPARRSLTITVRPRRFAGVSLEEITLGAALG